MIRLFVVDDHPMVRLSIGMLIEREEDFVLCGEAATAEDAVARIPEARPDIALVDLSLPDMDGIELIGALRAQMPALHLVMLTGHGERSYVEGALAAGAHGYIVKGDAASILPALRSVMAGETYVSDL